MQYIRKVNLSLGRFCRFVGGSTFSFGRSFCHSFGLSLCVSLGLFIVLLVGGTPSWGSEELSPVSVPVLEGDRMVIRNFKGKIRLVGNSKAKSMQLKMKKILPATKGKGDTENTEAMEQAEELATPWSIHWRKESGVIQVVVSGPMDKDSWVEKEGREVPSFQISIVGPSVPVEIFQREGKIQVNQWMDSLKVSQLKGQLNIEKGEGPAQLQLESGKLKLISHKGAVRIKSYDGTIVVNKLEGSLDLENFSGNSQLTGLVGDGKVAAYKGKVKISHQKGHLIFANVRSSLKVTDLEGSIQGTSETGTISLSLNGKVNVSVKSKYGSISLRLRGSGASVNVGTQEGSLYVPTYLKLLRLPNWKIRRGNLRGISKGYVRARTESGNIRIF